MARARSNAAGNGLPSAAKIARELVAVPTVNPPGHEAPAIEYVDSVLGKSGVETRLFEKVPGRPNLMARLTGRGESPGIVLHGHVDVVGVDGQDWDHPPFDGIVEDGVLHGRGALDMKSGVAMMTHAFAKAAMEGVRPSGDVILTIVADSETGGSTGLAYLLEAYPELFDGVGYAVGEFGGFPMYLFDHKFYRIGVSQKQYAHLRLRMSGGGGHGSSLAPNTVAGKLGRALIALDQARLPYHRTRVAERIVEAIAAAVPDKETILGELLQPDEFEEALTELGPYRTMFESLFRDTANPTIIEAGAKFNVIPSEAAVDLDVRLLPGRDLGAVLAELQAIIDEDIELEILATGPGGGPDFDDRLMPTLSAILQDLDPLGVPIPFMFNESPDGRLFHELGIQHYGFLPMDLPPHIDLPSLVHGPNERVPLEAVEFGARALHQLINGY